MKTIRIIFLLLLLVSLSSCYSKYLSNQAVYKKPKDQLRVVTYNVNWGESNWPITTPQTTVNAIRKLDGDVVLLQEATPFWQDQFRNHLKTLYPYQLFKPQDNGGGLALLSKHPILDQRYTHSPMGWHPGWVFNMQSPHGVIQIANLHLTPPLISKTHLNFSLDVYFSTPKVRENEMEYYYQFIQPHYPTIIAGDFNEGSKGFVSEFLQEHGYTEAQILKGMHKYTWRWTFGFFTVKESLDHVFYDDRFKASQVQVLREGDSDHFPLAVDLIRV